jgi:hypothetical protein
MAAASLYQTRFASVKDRCAKSIIFGLAFDV